MQSSPQPSPTADCEIVISRTFDAPRELAVDAWLDPNHLAQWFGPNGFTITTHELTPRVGGVWRLTMHGPDGRDYPNRIIYTEIIRPEFPEYSHDSGTDNDRDSFHIAITFEDVAGKTALTMRSIFKSADEREHVVKEHHAIEGGRQTLQRLAEFLSYS